MSDKMGWVVIEAKTPQELEERLNEKASNPNSFIISYQKLPNGNFVTVLAYHKKSEKVKNSDRKKVRKRYWVVTTASTSEELEVALNEEKELDTYTLKLTGVADGNIFLVYSRIKYEKV